MSHKRSYQQREEPWLPYPERQVSFSRSHNNGIGGSSSSAQQQPSLTTKALHDHHRHSNRHHSHNHNHHHHHHSHRHLSRHEHDPLRQHYDRTRSSTSLASSSSYTSVSSTGSMSTVSSTPPPPQKSTISSLSSSVVAASQPRSLSEELAMALQASPLPSEDVNVSSPPSSIASPTELMSSPQDLPSPLVSASTHFPLLKPPRNGSSSSSTSSSSSRSSSKPRPSPLSLNGISSMRTGSGPLFRPTSGSPTAAHLHRDLVNNNTTDTAMSPGSAANASLGTPPLVGRRGDRSGNGSSASRGGGGGRGSQSATASASSFSLSTCSESSSPRTASPRCSALCSHHTQHHPHCPQHHCDQSSRHSSSTSLIDRSNPRQQHYHHPTCQYYDPKAGRPTKGVSRFGIPRMSFFTPSVASSEPTSPTALSDSPTPLTRGLVDSSSDFGLSAFKAREGLVSDDEEDNSLVNNGDRSLDDGDKEQVGGQLRLYNAEPEPKKLRSRASMLLDVAVESIYFTFAVPLAAYQLLTGKGRQTPDSGDSASHSRDNSLSEAAQVPEEKAAPPAPISPRSVRKSHSLHHRSASTGHTTAYHKARTPRSHKARQHQHHQHHHHGHHGPNAMHTGGSGGSGGKHSRSQSMTMPARPPPEEIDEQFLRMETQLTELIAEGKRALNSRVEVWDE